MKIRLYQLHYKQHQQINNWGRLYDSDKELSISFKVSFKEDMEITKVNNIINEN